jgi:hydrolase, NUDIX family
MLQLPHGFQISAGNTAVAALLARPDTHILLFAGQKLIQRSEGPPALTRHDYGALLDGAAWHACEPLGTWQGSPWLAIGLDAQLPTGGFPASGATLPSHATPGSSTPAIGAPAVGTSATSTSVSGTHATSTSAISISASGTHAAGVSLPPGWEAAGLRSWFGRLPDGLAAIAMQASQLLEWQRTHRWCGACGVPTQRLTHERAVQCPRCGLRSYPRISPAMMVLITRGQQLLLASNVSFPEGRYSALAGFLEAGESVEAALHREVAEEVGLQVHDLRYFGSQSWPFPHALMLAFTAEWLAGDISVDPTELRDARWFDPDALPDLPPANVSISRALVEATARRLVKATHRHRCAGE